MKTSITLEEAREIYARESEGSILWAAANTVISLYQVNITLLEANNELETLLAIQCAS